MTDTLCFSRFSVVFHVLSILSWQIIPPRYYIFYIFCNTFTIYCCHFSADIPKWKMPQTRIVSAAFPYIDVLSLHVHLAFRLKSLLFLLSLDPDPQITEEVLQHGLTFSFHDSALNLHLVIELRDLKQIQD